MKKGIGVLFVLLFCAGVLVSGEVLSSNPSCFKTESAGDVNDDGVIDISDVVGILTYLFKGQSIVCLNQANVNGDSKVDISDAVALLNYLFGDSIQGKKPVHINHPPFLAITPSLKSEVNFVSDEPILTRLYDANFDEEDVVSCTGIARLESGEEIDLFNIGDGVNLLGSWYIEPYYFILDLSPGKYDVEISCVDQAGNLGKDITSLNLQNSECTSAGDECKSSCGSNEESSGLSCTGEKVCCKPKPVEICGSMDRCCATLDKNKRQVYECIEGCQLYSPSCSSLDSIDSIFPEYDSNGNQIKHSWFSASSTYCNDPNANPPDAPSVSKFLSEMCELPAISSNNLKGNWEKISTEPSPSSTPTECKVKSLTILHGGTVEPYLAFKGLWQTQKTEFPNSPGLGEGGSFYVYDPEWGQAQEELKNDLRYTEHINYGFIVRADYVGIKTTKDAEGKVSFEEVSDVDTMRCREFQFKEVNIIENEGDKREDLYGAVYPMDSNVVLKLRSLLDLKDELRSREEVFAFLDSEKGLTKSKDLGCPLSIDIKERKKLCQDDYFYQKKVEPRIWSESFYSSAEDKEVSIPVKIHNHLNKDGSKSMTWYDAPSIQITGYNRYEWERVGYFTKDKKGGYMAIVEDENGLGRMRCEISPISLFAGYNKNAQPLNRHMRLVKGPTKCECVKEEKTFDTDWEQVGDTWKC